MTLLEFDKDVLVENFSERPFRIRHNLVGHPLFTLERLAQLADDLPEDQVEHNLGDIPELLPGGEAPRLDMTPGEVARTIVTNGCWLVLKFVESDPEYSAVLDETLAEVIPLVADKQGGATYKQGFIFLTAPRAVTPLHSDPEQNLLLQLKADKEIDVGWYPNEEVEREHLTQYYSGSGHRNLDAMPGERETFVLTPGDGVHVPLNAPHAVRNYDDVSISFSITFNTQYSELLNDVYSVNGRMRKLHLPTSSFGEHRGRDKVKAALWRTMRRGKRAVQTVSGRNGSPS